MSTKPTPFTGETLREVGEFGLIDRIAARFGPLVEGDWLGIGDDCAVIPWGTGGEGAGGELPEKPTPAEVLLATTDLLVEGSHFRLEWTTPEDLGYKALAVNLSDVAAMGGKPFGALMAIGIPEALPVAWVERFMDGVHALCREHGVALLGGDTTRSRNGLVVDFTVLGRAREADVRLRSHARPGDLVAMTGWPGESGAGLSWRLEHAEAATVVAQPADNPDLARMLLAHDRPRVFVREGAFLGRMTGVGAMLDLSDGLLSDAGHIAVRSGCDLWVDVEQVPVSRALGSVCERYGWDPLRLALSAGEDYGLLFTLRPELAQQVLDAYEATFGERPTLIGRVSPCADRTQPALRLRRGGEPWRVPWSGFDHFRR